LEELSYLKLTQDLVIPVYSTIGDISGQEQGFIAFVEDEGRIVFEDGV